MTSRIVLTALLLAAMAGGASARKVSERERLRDEAASLCYDDVQKLCSDVVSDETKVQACMKAKRAQLSPGCRKAFDKGQK